MHPPPHTHTHAHVTPHAPCVQCGVPVRVLERAPGLRAEGAAIGLWANAWRALGALDAKAADTLRAETLRLGRCGSLFATRATYSGARTHACMVQECRRSVRCWMQGASLPACTAHTALATLPDRCCLGWPPHAMQD